MVLGGLDVCSLEAAVRGFGVAGSASLPLALSLDLVSRFIVHLFERFLLPHGGRLSLERKMHQFGRNNILSEFFGR
jgi:hypothetical protein